ncbi:MAG TPA: arylamine N-acetyltransferase [Ktedonobacterales bacterium]|nr:arylamine N-acetyltransferase [Ktedonobacterales bacterium]
MSTIHTPADSVDLNPQDYLDRIGFSSGAGFDSLEPSLPLLQALHEAHMLAAPFENLSIHYGQPIVLREEALYDKIVRRHRGGFCYELNGLFAWLLRRLGFEVTLLSAEVAQAGGGYSPEFDHLTLLVHHVDGADWVADVGFGDSYRRPLRLRANEEQDGADGRLYRLQEDRKGDRQDDVRDEQRQRTYWIVQQRGDTGDQDDTQWEPQYRFTFQPHALTDFTERCRYHQTSPDSHFTQQRICSRALPLGRMSLSDMRLITTIQGNREEHELRSDEEYREILAQSFGIVL